MQDMQISNLQTIEIISGHDELILYGAGNIGHRVFSVITTFGGRVRCFLDKQAQPGANWQGVPIYQPDNNPLTPEERKNIPVIISIFNRDTDIPAISGTLFHLGYQICTSFVDFHSRFYSELGDHYWLTHRGYYDQHQSEINEAASLWNDDESRKLFNDFLIFRKTGDYAFVPKPDFELIQYFWPRVPGWPPKLPLRFVDCGAYDGDTLEILARTVIPVSVIAAIEPDMENFRHLADNMSHFSAIAAEATVLLPCGVGACSEMRPFATGLGESAHIGQGNTFIPCVALDDALTGFRPNFIKMDIEGAELEALAGAAGIIEKYHPALAICAYHRPGDLWEIPLYLQRLRSDYRFYLRAHAYNGFEMVLYAISS